MKTKTFFLAIISTVITSVCYAHCEIPCGIYDDQTRIILMREHITTIEKSMKAIQTISESADTNNSQFVRWVVNKEEHATKLQEIVWQYFMTQRIKPVSTDAETYQTYVKQLTLLHEISVYAMKAKQTIDLDIVEKLRTRVTAFEASYFNKEM